MDDDEPADAADEADEEQKNEEDEEEEVEDNNPPVRKRGRKAKKASKVASYIDFDDSKLAQVKSADLQDMRKPQFGFNNCTDYADYFFNFFLSPLRRMLHSDGAESD